jgi:polysaccharide deacetylase 2 family uncharacterized protein YibQ
MAKNAIMKSVMRAIEKRAIVLVDAGTAAGNAIADATEEVLGLKHHRKRLAGVKPRSAKKRSVKRNARKRST